MESASFLIGLGSFALAHLAYIVLFCDICRRTGPPILLWSCVLLVYAVSTRVLARHRIPAICAAPVRLYVVLITGMGVSALALPGWVGLRP